MLWQRKIKKLGIGACLLTPKQENLFILPIVKIIQSITADYLLRKMKQDKSVCAITSATPAIMGFTEEKRKEAGAQFIDVGIAEEHAVAMASGIAANGGKPVYGVYSTFMQRTYDQLSQDLCVNNNAVTIPVFFRVHLWHE